MGGAHAELKDNLLLLPKSCFCRALPCLALLLFQVLCGALRYCFRGELRPGLEGLSGAAWQPDA